MKVKICGLTEKDHVFTCIDNSSDFCGFILNYLKAIEIFHLKRLTYLQILKKKYAICGSTCKTQRGRFKKIL